MGIDLGKTLFHLVGLNQRAQRDGFQLALVAPAPPVDRAIQVSGLGETLPFVSPSAIA